MTQHSIPQGARGGHAIARGNDSVAIGGDAGEFGIQPGGRGGDVDICDPGITAVGGKGGRGGVIPGMPGMDITQPGGSVGSYIEGGMGGEAPQPDGRGGRGARPPQYELICRLLGKTPRPYMKRPYWDQEAEPGCGGDGADTPRYRARRLIIEMLKADYLLYKSYFSTEVWYKTDNPSIEILNIALARRDHSWRVGMDDGEYTFTDIDY